MFKKTSLYFILILFIIVIPYLTIAQDQNKQNGIKYINEGKYRQAIDELEKDILKNPSDAEALFYLGVAYRNLGSGQLKNALSGMSQALRIRPKDPNWQYELAQIYDDMDKFGVSFPDTNRTTYELAVEAYKRAIDLDPTSINAHLSLGELYLRKGNSELAAEKFNDVLKIDAKNAAAYSYLVDCLSKLERYNDAIIILNKWSNIDPYKLEPYNLKGKIFWSQGKYEDAQREYQRVIEVDPNNQLARARLDSINIMIQNRNVANELLKTGETLFYFMQYEQAIDQFEKIIKIDPNNSTANIRLVEARTKLSDYWFNRGLDRVRNNEIERAVEYFNKALEYAQTKNQREMILKSWREAQIALGEKAQMYKVYEEGQRAIIRGDYSIARSYLDVIFREGDQNQEKIKQTIDTLVIAENYQRAKQAEFSRDFVSALVYFDNIFKMDSTYRDTKYLLEKNKGEIAFQNRNWDSSIKHFDKAIKIDNKDISEISLKIDRAKLEKRILIFKELSPFVIFLFIIIVVNYILIGKLRKIIKTDKQKIKNFYAILPKIKYNPYCVSSALHDDDLFIDREKEIYEILSGIHNLSYLIIGNEKIGKTSLLNKIIKILKTKELINPDYEFIVSFIDLQGVSEEKLFVYIIDKIAKDVRSNFPNCTVFLNNKINSLDDKYYAQTIIDFDKYLFELGTINKKKNKFVIVIDEMNVMVPFSNDTKSAFRRIFFSLENDTIRIIGATKDKDKEEWTGSGSDWSNLFVPISLENLSEEKAIELIKKPVENIFNYSEKAIKKIIHYTNCNPYYIQNYCRRIIEKKWNDFSYTITDDDVDLIHKEIKTIGIKKT